MEIRRAHRSDIDAIMPIYESAKAFMRACGNSTQWADGYPDRATILADIDAGYCHVGIDNEGNIAMVFAFIIGEDPTYATIEDGQWPDNSPYGTIHRMASSGAYSGMLRACTEYCLGKIDTLRLDTHADNIPMQKAARATGYVRCGIIICRDGTPRIAYQLSQASV